VVDTPPAHKILFDIIVYEYYYIIYNLQMKGVCIMAKSKRQNYTIDTTKKIITATISELDTVEKEIVQMYINAGYVLHKGKSNPWNKTSIVKCLKYYISE
jgi:hypothetical protein